MDQAGMRPPGPASRLSPAAQALLEERLKRRAAGSAPRQGIPRRAEPGPAPLSFAQERIWFLARLAPGSPAYNIARAFVLRGPLDRDALARSLHGIARRHEVLRTTFTATGALLAQRISAEPAVPLATVDLAGLPDLEAEMERLRRSEAELPFDLERGPLQRTVLLRTGQEEHTLLLTIHHIVADGWSMDVLFRELGALYRGMALPELPVQYADFAVWQRGRLQGAHLDHLMAYWRARLDGAPPVLELPSDRPRPGVRTWAGGLRTFDLAVPAAAVRATGAAQGASLFIVLLAAFFAVLRRTTGRDDLVAGTPVAGRDRSELEDLIGLFVNTLVLRADLGGDPTFEEVLRRTREATLGAYNHQEMPFDKLVEVLAPERDLSSTPLFQVLFALENTGRSRLELPGLAVIPRQVWSGTAKFDLSFTLLEDGEGLCAALVYDREIFDPSTLVRLAGHFATFLAGAVANLDRRLSDLPLLDAAESQQLLREWNDTAAPYPEGPCLHELIAAQAARSPQRVAVVFEGESLTYAELEAAAGRLAHRLAGQGVGPDVPVGVCAERSLEMVVGLLAVLKSGGAYLPLDPSYPADRLAYMLEDSRVPVLLAQSRLLERLPDPKAAVLLLDGMAAAEASTAASPGPLPGSSNLAYVIYTSGSTGRPKGTMNSHGGIVNRLLWMQERFGLTPDDAVLQKTPFSFDVSVWEFFWPLLAGARLVMARPGGHQDPSYLIETIAGEGITTLHFVPSMLQAFVEAPGVERCVSLTRVVCSGEAFPAELERRFYARMPVGAALYNLYGPTEAAVDVTCWACEREGRHAAVPIGTPVANTRIHLLDRDLRPVPAGVPGELYIGGVQVGRGYLGRSGLTAERFVPDPFEPGARLYRSGDLARHLPAGEIEFLGRIDHQVKIRGFRIELQEIEAALAALPAVREAVVVALDGGSVLDRRLAAYLVASGAGELSPAALRESLKEKLPDYMVPAAFVVLPSLPLSANGKVDRRALPAPEAAVFAGAAGERPFAAPRTELERLLAGLWKEHLGRAAPVEVGVHDDFFALGGNSLGAALLVNRLQEKLGGSIRVAALFEASTVERMARYLSERHAGAVAADTIIPVELPPGAPVPLSYSQERLWFLARFEPESPFYNIPAPLRLSGRLDVPALAWSLREIRRRHSVLRAVFGATAAGPVQRIGELLPAALPVVDLSGIAPGEAERLAAEEARRPFNLEAGPPLRTSLLKLAEEEHLLLLTVHHIVTDGWSMGVLIRELSAHYTSAPLAESPIQYSDYARWQRERLSGEVLEEQLAYWRRQLAGAPALLELPTDRPRPPAMRFRGGRVPAGFGPRLTAALAALGRERGATLFMALTAGFAALLSRVSGFLDIPLGTILSGRTRPECEDLIGLFVNTLVLRVDLAGDPGFGAVLGRVRRVAVEAYTHQDAPFERLVQELRPERSLAHSPLFQAMVMLADGPGQQVELPGLTIAFEQPESGTVKFDLSLGLAEEDGRLTGSLAFNSDLFDATTAVRLARHLETFLEGAVADPDRPLSELALLTAAERHQARLEWNDTAAPFPRGLCLHETFAAQAARTPEARAIASLRGGEGLTYGELERRSNRLANRLRRLGVGPEVRVGIALERSPAMVAALLAVLKAGGAYVPLDPSYPRERLAFILADADSPVLLSDRKVLDRLPPFSGTALLLDDEEAAESDEAPESGVTSGNLAYLIYTSGSTGRPKGVAIEHRSASALLSWARSVFPPEDLAGVLASTSITFDLSVFELFLPLSTGGMVVLAENALELAETAPEGVRLVNTVPSAMAALVRDGALPGSVRTVNLAGEPLKRVLVDRIYAVPGVERVFNLYGPSEDTTYSTWVRVPRGEEREPTIGVPIADTRAYVLDARLNLLPVGAPGELLLGGAGLARGYLNRPDLTAERFVPDPAGRPGERLYRTGDLVRRRADGELEFLGRLDHQVKIRGFRIELGEIEAALLAHPEVREAVVVARAESGETRLVAYTAPGVPAGLRESLRERLPDYMIPAAFVGLESLPLTPNGKVDRKSLPASERRDRADEEEEGPRRPLEEILAGIWSEVLRLERVGVRANFFELGGHSLLATQVVSRVREVCGVELPLRRLFESPTVEDLAAQVEAARRAEASPAEPPLVKLAREPGDPPPASFAQERLWFLDRLGVGGAPYHLSQILRLLGSLDVGALRAALDGVVGRHEVLRTSFALLEQHVVQVSAPELRLELPVVDLAPLPPAARAAEAEALTLREASRTFDLARLPLVRATLLRLGAEEHLLLLTLHHIVSDGWSTGILLRELSALYARREGLPELPLQYADFAAWQRERLRGDVLERLLAFWRERLAGAPALLELPTDRPRPAVLGSRGGRSYREIPAVVVEGLRALCRRQGTTLFMAVLAAFQTVLARAAGSSDVSVGSPIANRNRLETEGLIGLFVNTLVLRTDLSGDPVFADLLGRVRDTTLEAYAHQDVPFEKLVEELRLQRDTSHTPLFQVMLILQNNPASGFDFPGVEVRAREVDTGTAKFDLNVALGQAGGIGDVALAMAAEYNRDLFDQPTVVRLLAGFETLLAGISVDPSRRLSELPLLPDAARQQILREWNDTAAPCPRDLCLHQPFEERAARFPEATALVFGEERLSYGELDRRANRLAHRLRSLGVGGGRMVAVHLDRGPGMIVALLAIQKAGGAYVPVEVTWPPDRVRGILASQGIAWAVTSEARREAIDGMPSLPDLRRVVCLEEPLDGLPDTAPPPAAGPDDLAYVIFTSGSTGRPKGVMVRHRPAVNLIDWVNRTFGVGPADRLLFVTNLSFDLSVYDVFGILAAGGSIHIASAAEQRDAHALVRLLSREPITFWDSAPAALQHLVPFFPPLGSLPEPPALRLVFLSGDWIPVSLPDRVRESFPGARVVSLGGATEATIWSNFYPVGRIDPACVSIPYGRPIQNARYHVLDAALGPCPVGAAGDLYIGGECLSDGYAGEPGMTAASYLPDPFAGEAGARMYRTGDRARYGPDGNLEFLGRVDTQVKVRGFRIELGEIQSVLASHPGVREAVVLVREDTPGDQRLVAYVIPELYPPPAPLELRRWAQRTLPEYMVPTAFVLRESWPLAATGKLDRKALPAPEAALVAMAAGAEASFEPPRTEMERTLAAIWCEVIGLQRVGVRESFFDAGGHSLLLARVHSRLEEALGRKVPLVDLFQYPTVESLARHLEPPGQPATDPLPGERLRIAPDAVASEREGMAIAVVGMAGRFPGAASVDELWRNLRHGVESIRFFSDEELLAQGFPPQLLDDPRLVKARGALAGPDLFDAAFFDYPPREAQIMDPQQRLFLECAWQAMEHAGYGSDERRCQVGVFAGVTENTYVHELFARPGLIRAVGRQQVSIANNHDYLPARVSYKLNLNGPSVNVQTACSTSLVAVHYACLSLLHGECDMALAGGVSVQAREVSGYLYQEGGISSPDGHTRAFDARARGVVGGSGAGIVVLKRLADALADGDTIHAVLRGSASNNDGAGKVGFTAPSVEGQAAVIREALRVAGVDAAAIDYVEAHGTGTALGDPIEVAALRQAFGSRNGDRCALGSIKTNIGHLDAASGVAGLIKTVLALRERTIPPSLHFERPNPEIDFGPFFVNTQAAEWPKRPDRPRRAGVSSFGIGGTNAHAVLEEPPVTPAGDPPRRPAHLLLLSAKSATALEAVTASLADHLEAYPEIDACGMADLAYTLQLGRKAFRHRRALVCCDRDDALAALRSLDPERVATSSAAREERTVAFLFPGQGAQHIRMAEGLYRAEPVFRDALDRCCDLLQPLAHDTGFDLRAVLFPAEGEEDEAERRLRQTAVTQPALFAVEHSLARLWISWGIRPGAMIGHSIGEYVAACLAGVFSLEDALKLVAARGRLMQELPAGDMLAVPLPEEEVRALLAEDPALSLAAVNAPAACVVSGPAGAVEPLRAALQARGLEARPLHTSHAFHSAMMEPILEPFGEVVAGVALSAPRLRCLSNVTGGWLTAEQATDPGYWVRHLRETVRFADGLGELLRQPGPVLLEVGPGRTLCTLARQHSERASARLVVSSLGPARNRRPDVAMVLEAASRLWLESVEVDGAAFHAPERRRRVPLPTYPFERRRYWVDGPADEPAATPASKPPAADAALSDVEREVADVWQELLGVEEVRPHDDFFEVGGSSLMAVQLGSRLRQALGVELPSDFLLEASTLRALAAMVEQARRRSGDGGGAEPERPRSCLVRLQAGSLGRRPLFLVHQVGGHVFTFRALARALGPDQPFYGLRSRGLERGEEPLESLEDMAAAYVELVRQVQPAGPYRIGGASMGGMVAFEMAHQLRAARQEVELLVLMDTPCLDQMPHRPEHDGEFVATVFAGRIPLTPEELAPLGTEEQLAYAVEKARSADPTGGLSLEEARRLFRVLRANVAALFEYAPRPYAGRLLFFRARVRRPFDPPRPELPWIELAERGAEVLIVPGDHQTMHDPPHLETMAERLKPLLAG